MSEIKPGTLYSIGIPIGNIRDLSLRAIDLLGSVDIIACEQTPKLKDLLKRASIISKAKFFSYYSYNEKNSSEGIINALLSGLSVAVVSSAGTPRVSDPGYDLVKKAYLNKIQVVPVPGPSAITAIMSIAPIPVDPLIFVGFISPKEGKRRSTIIKYNSLEATVCFYESVHRIEKLLKEILLQWGDVEVFIAREMTKPYESSYWGTVSGSISWLDSNKKGEFVVLVHKKALSNTQDE